MSISDKIVAAVLMLVWAWIGYQTALQRAKGDEVGFWIGIAIIVGFPLVAFIRPAIKDWLWRRKWERQYGKKWSESEAGKD